jgi:hypothetical protein
VVSARGPNLDGSFTTLPGERTIRLRAEVGAPPDAGWIRWEFAPPPGADVRPALPPGLAFGPDATTDMPAQSASRWRLPHGAPLSARALAVQVTAALPDLPDQPGLRDSTVVRQREVDVLRQEYVDFGLSVPTAAEVRAPADVAGTTRFSWAQLNQGDYNAAVLTPRLLAGLNAMDALSGRTLVPTSVFRNPAHHRFHIRVSGGFATAQKSQHQYGTAVDVSTGRDLRTWHRLYSWAKQLGACAEPLEIATVNHVHADWRPEAPDCPKGW